MSPTVFFGLSHDEWFGLYAALDDAGQDGGPEEENESLSSMDLRPLLQCEYVVDIVASGGEVMLAAGSHSEG